MYRFIVLTTFILNNLACETTSKIQSEEFEYQKDLVITESGMQIVGFGVFPERQQYNFHINSRHNPDRVRISNCHRDETLYSQSKNFSYKFTPNKLVERGNCILHFNFFDANGYHQFGSVVFNQKADTLQAKLSCNGVPPTFFEGTSTCQGKVDTVQAISFHENVRVVGECPLPKSEDGKFWLFKLTEGTCLYTFKSDKDEFHSLTTFGYNEIIKR